jgi:hypothetical protein
VFDTIVTGKRESSRVLILKLIKERERASTGRCSLGELVPNPQPPDRVGSNLIQDKRSWFTLSVKRNCLHATNESMTARAPHLLFASLHTRVAFRGGWWDVERLCVTGTPN